jgi:hypothetical protein
MRHVFAGLLALAFVASCVLLVSHIATANAIDFGTVGELLLVAVLSVEGIVAVHHLAQSRLDSVHQTLAALHQDYRSAEMLLAVGTLWRLRREHSEDFGDVYLQLWKAEQDSISGKPAEEQLEATTASLHHRRRTVSLFYNLLAGLYELRVFPRKVIYRYWTRTDLGIIPEIVIPLEETIAGELRTSPGLAALRKRLLRLYDDSEPSWPRRLTARWSRWRQR